MGDIVDAIDGYVEANVPEDQREPAMTHDRLKELIKEDAKRPNSGYSIRRTGRKA